MYGRRAAGDASAASGCQGERKDTSWAYGLEAVGTSAGVRSPALMCPRTSAGVRSPALIVSLFLMQQQQQDFNVNHPSPQPQPTPPKHRWEPSPTYMMTYSGPLRGAQGHDSLHNCTGRGHIGWKRGEVVPVPNSLPSIRRRWQEIHRKKMCQ